MIVLSRYSWWAGAMLAFALALTLGARVGALGPVEGTVLRITSPAESGLTEIFRPVANFLGNVRELNDLREENRQLRVENEALRNQVTLLQEDQERIAQLEEALDILQSEDDEQRIAATIISQDKSAFTDVVSINRGTDHGVNVGNVVISPQGSLVGKVIEADATRSSVRLLGDTRSRVNAVILETDADGSVQGNANGSLSFELGRG